MRIIIPYENSLTGYFYTCLTYYSARLIKTYINIGIFPIKILGTNLPTIKLILNTIHTKSLSNEKFHIYLVYQVNKLF